MIEKYLQWHSIPSLQVVGQNDDGGCMLAKYVLHVYAIYGTVMMLQTESIFGWKQDVTHSCVQIRHWTQHWTCSSLKNSVKGAGSHDHWINTLTYCQRLWTVFADIYSLANDPISRVKILMRLYNPIKPRGLFLIASHWDPAWRSVWSSSIYRLSIQQTVMRSQTMRAAIR